MNKSVDEPKSYYLSKSDPNKWETAAGPMRYGRLVKHIQQAGEHAMVHAHSEYADVFCMDYDCEVWYNG